jgi:hypothetical protein
MELIRTPETTITEQVLSLFVPCAPAQLATPQMPPALGRRRPLQSAVANAYAQVLARARQHTTSFALGGI